MTPEQRRTNGKAVSIFNNLAEAVKQGAIGAQYENGQIVIYPSNPPDKDFFEQMVDGYEDLLRSRGIPLKDVRKSAEDIRINFYAGTATQQSEVFNRLHSVIDSSLNH